MSSPPVAPADHASTRELILSVERGVKERTAWAMFEPNGPELWARIRQNLELYLESLLQQGALAGPIAEEAYFVRCGMAANSQGEVNQGVVNIVVGFAPLYPAEFVILSIQQLTGQPPK